MSDLLIHPYGMKCFIGAARDIPAAICAAQIGLNDAVLYNVCWMHEGVHYEAWMSAHEFSTQAAPEKEIGFAAHARL